MTSLYDWVKGIALFQVALILVMVGLLYAVRWYASIQQRREQKEEKNIETLLHALSLSHAPPTKKHIKLLTHHIAFVLSFLQNAKQTQEHTPLFHRLHPLLSTHVLQPYARQHANAWRWLKRYLSAWCFSFGFDAKDETALQALIKDSSNMVSLLASQIAFQYEHPTLIQTVIRVFSHGRRLQQSVYAEITVKKTMAVTRIVLESLPEQNDLYSKIFSYKLLKWLPPVSSIPPCAKADLKCDVVDLTVAILQYIEQLNDPTKKNILYHQTKSPHWEVRAICATLLKDFQTKQSYTLLKALLKDSQWWVRTNAAHALAAMGEEGIACLTHQTIASDRFAYDAAQEALSQIEQTTDKR